MSSSTIRSRILIRKRPNWVLSSSPSFSVPSTTGTPATCQLTRLQAKMPANLPTPTVFQAYPNLVAGFANHVLTDEEVSALGLSELVLIHQIHESSVIIAQPNQAIQTADAVITNQSDLLLGTRVAD